MNDRAMHCCGKTRCSLPRAVALATMVMALAAPPDLDTEGEVEDIRLAVAGDGRGGQNQSTQQAGQSQAGETHGAPLV